MLGKKNNIRVVYKHMKLTVRGVLKDFPKKELITN